MNGERKETQHEFVDDGTEITFDLDDDTKACIKTASSGNKKKGIVYLLQVDDKEIPEADQ